MIRISFEPRFVVTCGYHEEHDDYRLHIYGPRRSERSVFGLLRSQFSVVIADRSFEGFRFHWIPRITYTPWAGRNWAKSHRLTGWAALRAFIHG